MEEVIGLIIVLGIVILCAEFEWLWEHIND